MSLPVGARSPVLMHQDYGTVCGASLYDRLGSGLDSLGLGSIRPTDETSLAIWKTDETIMVRALNVSFNPAVALRRTYDRSVTQIINPNLPNVLTELATTSFHPPLD